MTARICTLARWLLALIMLIGGANGFLQFLPVPQPLHPVLQAQLQSGYLAVPKLLELAGAALLLSRYRALALALLWPVLVNITLFHVFLDRRQLALVPVLLLLGVLASWPERQRFVQLLKPAGA